MSSNVHIGSALAAFVDLLDVTQKPSPIISKIHLDCDLAAGTVSSAWNDSLSLIGHSYDALIAETRRYECPESNLLNLSENIDLDRLIAHLNENE